METLLQLDHLRKNEGFPAVHTCKLISLPLYQAFCIAAYIAGLAIAAMWIDPIASGVGLKPLPP